MTRRTGFKLLPVALGLAAALAGGSAFAQEVVKIGYSGPLSGGAALYGKNVLTGLEMAVSEINAAGLDVKGKKYKLEVVALDDKYSPAESAINARRLAQQHRTPAVFVPHSGGIFAVQAFNEQEKFLLMAYSSVPKVTEAGNKLSIRIPPVFTGYVDPFVQTTMKRYGKRVGLLPADHDYAKAWTAAFVPAWKAAGGTVVSENPMSYNKSADFYSGVSRVLAEKPDVLFIGGASEPTALVAKQARELGFKGGFAIMDQAKLDEMARVTGGYAMLEGSIGVMPLVADERPSAKAFVENFRKKHGADRDPTSETSYNYTMVHALASAMKLAGSVDDAAAIRAKMSDALKSLPPANNPSLISGIDDKGGSIITPAIAVVEGGQLKPSAIDGAK
ncbi:ABC transporter substrate-binding protein [Caldimonas tepidiphila]|uniref:ABC transporter substrate-binding protein n=1 Tax=Caldimonas tepidiphila TaxID=2315841 RepID=UPI000E5A737D|nr:ABC transporter substrate-binding protein [Caldimonas tepidiphila]